MDKNKIIFGALIALGFLLLGLCIKSAAGEFANKDRNVSVRGLSERVVDADKVTWPIVTKELGNDLTAIYARIQSTNQRITRFLKDNGLADSEFSINPPTVEDRMANAYDNRDVNERYLVTNVIVVNSSKVDLVRKLINKQSELMRDGIALVADNYQYPTTFDFTGLNDIKPGMITEATENARVAAERFAQDSHSSLGKIVTAGQGQFSITDRDQYTPYKKNVRVVTSITYELRN